jgi:transcriptional regulator with XRE-family HTH domain
MACRALSMSPLDCNAVAIEHVARELEMHPTTLSRIETGRRGILSRDLKPILAIYGVTGERRKVRMERQARLSSDPALNLWVVLDEAALRRTVSGPEVMRRQLQRLTEVADRPGITLQVLPFAAGEHPGMTSSFVILRFPEPPDPDVVYLENFTSGLYVEEQEEIARYTLVCDHLGAMALSPRESASPGLQEP